MVLFYFVVDLPTLNSTKKAKEAAISQITTAPFRLFELRMLPSKYVEMEDPM